MRQLHSIVLTIIGIALSFSGMATHIIGGEMYYECMGNNIYKVTLKVYRDCYNGQAQLDNPAYISVYNAQKTLVTTLTVNNPPMAIIPVDLSNPCLIAPPNVCVQEGIYVKSVSLPPSPGGYYLVYQRCCRNGTIINLSNPGSQGATYMAHIPDSSVAVCNSSPYFKNFPPVVICANEMLAFDHSAIDPDGDSLSYNLCSAFQGASQGNPAPNPASPPPYNKLTYNIGYSASNPLPANPPISINPQTGLLTGKPNMLGQYVVGVCVKEYRNGVYVGNHRREFQFNVANCDPLVIASIPIALPDTSIINCSNYTVNFGNGSYGANSYHWDFGVPGVNNDTSNQKTPTFVFPDTGTYKVMLVANPRVVCSDTDYIYVVIYPYLKTDFDIQTACPYDPVLFMDSTTTTHGNIISWEWAFGDGAKSNQQHPAYTYNKEGTFTVRLKTRTDLGCEEERTKTFSIYPKPEAKFIYSNNCLNSPTSFFDYSSVSAGYLAGWEWHFGDGSPPSFYQNPSHTFTAPGTYDVTLIVKTENGCVDTLMRPVNIAKSPDAGITPDTTVCYREPVQLYADGGLFYDWEPQKWLDNPKIATPVARPKQTITYTVTVADSCYYDQAFVTIYINPLPNIWIMPDTSMFVGDSVFVTSGGSGITYSWNPAQGLQYPLSNETWASPEQTTTYTLTTVDINNCRNSEELTLYVRPICHKLYIPSAFTPNNDGNNDKFYVVDYGQNNVISFKILNRYGNVVFATNSIENGWDGTYRGRDQETGTYAYLVLVECDGQTRLYSGNLTLLR